MIKKCGWLLFSTAFLNGAMASAQGPIMPTTPYGVPGANNYSPTPYWAQPPVPDLGMIPNPGPIANDFPTPPTPPSMNPPGGPPWRYPQGPPAYTPPGEPYLVPPERPQPAPVYVAPGPQPQQMPFPQPGYAVGSVAPPPPGPGEPYVLYEGARYPAEEKEEGVAVWAHANFIHWWVRHDWTPPLVTTGNPGNPGAGNLSSNGTSVLLGDGPLSPNEFSGIQAEVGNWLDDDHMTGLQICGFWLGKITRQYNLSSNANGNPVLAQPIVSGGIEQALVVAFPGTFAGRIGVTTQMEMHGAEFNVISNLMRFKHFTIDLIGGFRYLYLSDALTMDQNIGILPLGAGAIPFPGSAVGVPVGGNVSINDSFNVTNRFYGGQTGIRFNWTCWKFDVDVVSKLGLGATTHTTVIDGFSVLTFPDGTRLTAPGGILAQNSNTGRHNTSDFSMVPELTATIGYQITPCIRLIGGYTGLYWTKIQRAADQIDRQVDLSQVPTSPTFGTGGPATRPSYSATRTDFWAQGVNVGVELRY